LGPLDPPRRMTCTSLLPRVLTIAARPCSVTPINAWGLDEDRIASMATVTEPSVPRKGEKEVRMGVKIYIYINVRTVLETDREGDTRSKFTMKLRLRCTSSNGTPGHEVCQVLRGNGIQKLRSDGNTQVSQVAEKLPCHTETLIDFEGTINVRVVDETFPSHSRAWFLVTGKELKLIGCIWQLKNRTSLLKKKGRR
jgi:hypothetical protein